ncbi:MAG: 3-hydroxybutyryl-CoA dehydrogenase, partial [Acidobacteria bacterium]|nr:3-hydroxybutyryl-CoA dehydrogenase [Acidobacteriota bacterium]
MAIQKIGVLGAGLMGAGIAQIAATSGHTVTLVEVSDELIQKGLSGIEKSLAKFAEKGALTVEQKDAALSRLRGTTKYEDLADADLIVEAIIENLAIKRDVYAKLDALCKPETIFASNTSSLSITEMMTAASAERQRRFVGLHFFNPVPLMKLVEVIRTILTDDAVYQEVAAL